MYNILEARIEYKGGKLHRVTVLVEISQGDIRALFSTVGPRQGYDYLKPDEPVNDILLQRVAGYGRETVDRDEIFPGWNRKHKVENGTGLKEPFGTGGYALSVDTFEKWLAALYYVTASETGLGPSAIKINRVQAQEWFESGATPYQCFRETWNMENDAGV